MGLLIRDEFERRWYVSNEDPAFSLVNSLLSKGFRDIVLPEETIKFGIVREKGELDGLIETLAGVYYDMVEQKSSPSAIAPVIRSFLTTSTMRDCCRSLIDEV